MSYLFDTNVLIYYFNGLVNDEKIDIILEKSFNISIITKIEFLSWSKLAQDKVLDKKAKAFVSYATLLDLDDNIAQRTIELRRKFKTKTPDAIIAATALEYTMSIVTNNISDFKRLGLDVVEINVDL